MAFGGKRECAFRGLRGSAGLGYVGCVIREGIFIRILGPVIGSLYVPSLTYDHQLSQEKHFRRQILMERDIQIAKMSSRVNSRTSIIPLPAPTIEAGHLESLTIAKYLMGMVN